MNKVEMKKKSLVHTADCDFVYDQEIITLHVWAKPL